jgi:hypothetical protein
MSWQIKLLQHSTMIQVKLEEDLIAEEREKRKLVMKA